MRSWIVAAALLVAGCATPAEPAVEANASEPTPSAGSVPSPPGLELARFAEGDAVDTTLWFNGTFKVHEARRAPQAPIPVASPVGAQVRFPLGDAIPVGYPSVVIAEVDMALAHGDVDLWVEIPDEDWRTGGACAPRGGYTRVEPGLVRSQGSDVMVTLTYDEAEPSGDVAYAVSARVRADPTVAPGGIPFALVVPPGTASVVVETVGERRDCLFDLDTPNLMAWGPDDAFLGHRPLEDGRTSFPLADADGGEYVLLLSQGGRGLRVHAPPGASLRPLGVEWVVSEPHRGGAPDRVEWTADLPRVPMLAGTMFATPAVAQDVTVSYASPAGILVDGTFTGGPWVGNVPGYSSSSFWMDSGFGVPALAAGTHVGSVAFGRGAGPEPLQASDVAAYWVR